LLSDWRGRYFDDVDGCESLEERLDGQVVSVCALFGDRAEYSVEYFRVRANAARLRASVMQQPQ
jgi:hypothetical protein